MIKSTNVEYERKRKRLEVLKKEMLGILSSVNIKALSISEQEIYLLLSDSE